jgi:3-deoxy-D-manno-octulosonic-acid transferase
MIWIYRMLYLPALLLVLPYYGFRMWRRGGYAKDFQHRFGFFHRLDAPAPGKKRIWLQAVSVGEVLAIGPLIRALKEDDSIEIIITTTTSTGYAEALKRYQQSTLCIGLFPLDFWPCMNLAWRRIQPNVVILTESELWPEHLHQAQTKNIPTFLVNARISEKSFGRYRKFSGLARRLLSKFDFIYATNQLNKNRLLELGAMPATIQSFGNIKFDVAVGEPISASVRSELLKELGFYSPTDQSQPFVLLGSSTWPGEEQALLKVQARLIECGTDCRLLLVPRHAERAAEIISLLKQQPLLWHQRSTNKSVPEGVRIYLADTTGELARLTRVADLAFIGKSLPPNNGGQTPIEAAGLGIPILMGPNTSNFQEVTRSLVRSGAARIVEDKHSLEVCAMELMNDTQTRESMSKAGINWHKRNRGSSKRIAKDILGRLNSR